MGCLRALTKCLYHVRAALAQTSAARAHALICLLALLLAAHAQPFFGRSSSCWASSSTSLAWPRRYAATFASTTSLTLPRPPAAAAAEARTRLSDGAGGSRSAKVYAGLFYSITKISALGTNTETYAEAKPVVSEGGRGARPSAAG
eukprot:scaffold3713_cov372-Prasinococcus_capsulatus_cf.AAC.12